MSLCCCLWLWLCVVVCVVVFVACVVWHAGNPPRVESKRLCVYIQNVSVCTRNRSTCLNTCGRGASTHGDWLRFFVFATSPVRAAAHRLRYVLLLAAFVKFSMSVAPLSWLPLSPSGRRGGIVLGQGAKVLSGSTQGINPRHLRKLKMSGSRNSKVIRERMRTPCA